MSDRREEPPRVRHPEIPWRTIVATRNRLIHGYPVVEEGVVWQTVTEDLPELVPALRRLLEVEGRPGR